MTVWMLRLPLTPEEENALRERTHLPLPFEGVPDLSQVRGIGECRQLMQVLYPGEPPETIMRRAERFWGKFSQLTEEDIITVPLKAQQQLAIAEINGRYVYRVGDKGVDVHLVPVKWHEKTVPLRKLSKDKALMDESGEPLSEVTDVETRTLIRDRLPYAYNRFAKWKWLLLLFFAMGLVRMFVRLEN